MRRKSLEKLDMMKLKRKPTKYQISAWVIQEAGKMPSEVQPY